MPAFTDFYRPIGSNLQIAPFNANATNDSLNEFAKVQMLRKQQDQQRQQEAQRLELDTKRANAEIAAQKARQEIENEKIAKQKKLDRVKSAAGAAVSQARQSGPLPPGTEEGIMYNALFNAGFPDEAAAVMEPAAKRAMLAEKVNPSGARAMVNSNAALDSYLLGGAEWNKPAPTVETIGNPTQGIWEKTTDSETGKAGYREVAPPLRESTPIQLSAGAMLVDKDGKVMIRNPLPSGGGGGGSGDEIKRAKEIGAQAKALDVEAGKYDMMAAKIESGAMDPMDLMVANSLGINQIPQDPAQRRSLANQLRGQSRTLRTEATKYRVTFNTIMGVGNSPAMMMPTTAAQPPVAPVTLSDGQIIPLPPADQGATTPTPTAPGQKKKTAAQLMLEEARKGGRGR